MSEKKTFLLRLPPDLYEKIQRLAAAELRSVNAQIELVLRQAVKDKPPHPDQPPKPT